MKDFFEKHVHLNWHMAMVVVSLLAVGGIFGYTLGYGDSGYEQIVVETAVRQNPRAVLGAVARHRYVNPFDYADLEQVSFPANQLKGCRNYKECHSFCAATDNYARCASWARSQGFVK
jgi:hypothetical protein